MNRQDFTGYIQHPQSLEPGMKEDLRILADRYSFSSSIQVLYTFLLQVTNDHEVNFQLKKAAAYTTCRKKLKELMEYALIKPNKTISPRKVDEFDPLHNHSREPDAHSIKDELMERLRKRLAEIAAEKQQESFTKQSVILLESVEQIEDVKVDFLSKEAIIEKFIKEEPRISQPKSSFYKPSEYAVKSNTDENDIVSETLARLYLEQGNIAKARMVYEKLSLLFPEKSSYFASQIKKIENK